MSSVEVSNLTKSYGAFLAVRNASFVADAGTLVSILGPSGCGKTTILRTIAGFEKATDGDVLLNDRSVAATPPWHRNIGLVFQSYALFPFMTVGDNVGYGLKMRKQPKSVIAAKTTDALERVGLPGSESKYPRQLSGGQRQRVALARALVCEPEVLLLDEPLSALDAKLRDDMQFELKRIQQRSGVTTLLVTHDQKEAFTLSDKIVVMNNAVVRQVGTPREIWENPNSAFVADFIGVENILECEAAGDTVHAGPHQFMVGANRHASGSVRIGIRAGDLTVATASASPSENQFHGEIVGQVYTGESFVYQVRTNIRTEPVILRTGKDRRLSGNVTLRVDPDKIMVLGEDTDGEGPCPDA